MKSTKELMARWRVLADADTRLPLLGRHCSMTICVHIDDEPWFMQIECGRVIAIDQGPFHMRHSDLQISAPHTSWDKFLSVVPPRGFHDLFAMSSYGHVAITGNQHLLREYLGFIKRLFLLPREVAQ